MATYNGMGGGRTGRLVLAQSKAGVSASCPTMSSDACTPEARAPLSTLDLGSAPAKARGPTSCTLMFLTAPLSSRTRTCGTGTTVWAMRRFAWCPPSPLFESLPGGGERVASFAILAAARVDSEAGVDSTSSPDAARRGGPAA